MNERYDVVIVGARPAGAALATLLARAGWRVLLVDRDRFPSDTVSTHVLFPDTLHLLDELGVLARLKAAHELPELRWRWRVLGQEVAGTFTPVGGFDRATCIRRIVLDAALLDVALDAGAAFRTGEVTGLVGAGVPGDPVRGVLLGSADRDGGDQIASRWVVGADGRVSTVARRLGLPATRERRGEMAFLFAYWRGLPRTEWGQIDVHERASLMSIPCEDGVHLLALAGPPELTRASAAERESRYAEGLRQFPAVLNPRLLGCAERVSPLVVVPETMMRGRRHQAAGPGWALVGDAGLVSHPATAQGIGDAVQQARQVAARLVAGRGLAGYRQWRDRRAEGHDEWSFEMGRFGSRRAPALFSGLAADPVAGQEFLDLLTKRQRPAQVFSPARLARWEAAQAYQDGQCLLRSLVADLDDERLAAPVPSCPEWTVRELLAHLAGVAADSARGTFFRGAAFAWQEPALAEARERWTAGHLAARAGHTRDQLLREFDDEGGRLVAMLREGSGPGMDGPAWLRVAPAADLAVHLDDLREALGTGVGHTGDDAASRLGFTVYRNWLGTRIAQRGLPPLRLFDGTREWVLGGEGEPAATVQAVGHELFRAVAGRRSAADIRAFRWAGDPEPYLPVLAPYPLPAQPQNV